ncbi:glycosyltransferase family 4 protein [Patescibacteria group bacterium]|nr:glycosyltransferase family 4 protein [Patescibacteria group bacterium]
MRILVIAPTPFFADRGCHIRIYEEAKKLEELGHQIKIVTYHHGRNIADLDVERIINISWYKKLSAGPSWHKIYLDILLFFKTQKLGKTFRPDIVHAHLHEGVMIAHWYSIFSRSKAPIVFDMQGGLVGELKSYGFIGNMMEKVFLALEKKCYSYPDVTVCSSLSSYRIAEEGLKLVNGKRVVLGIDGAAIAKEDGNISDLKIELGVSDDKTIVIYTGGLSRTKGVDLLLESASEVLKQNSQIAFVILGYPDVEHYKKVTKELGISSEVFFVGKSRYENLPKYLALADIAVDPKPDGSGEASGKMLNYMGAGLPVVCMDTENNRSLLPAGNIFVKNGSVDFAQGILNLIDDNRLRKRLKEKNSEKARSSYSWERTAGIINYAYQEIVSGK